MMDMMKADVEIKISKDKKYLLAVSGGVDSMVLADLFYKAQACFGVAHCHFGLRVEADADADLVKQWCADRHIGFYSKRFNTKKIAEEKKMGIQEVARDLRYAFFRELRKEHQFDYIVTAHHADDQIETVLFNLFRGTSIRGLRGMQLKKEDLLRPLLSFTKKDIKTYAVKEGVPFREDVSNQKNEYSRNFLRNEIIPQLENEFPHLKTKLTRTIERLNEVNEVYLHQIDQWRKQLLVTKADGELAIPFRKLIKMKPRNTILFELLTPYGLSEKQIPEFIKLMDARNGAKLITSTHHFYKQEHFILIKPPAMQVHACFFLEQKEGMVSLHHGKLKWQTCDAPPSNIKGNNLEVLIDAKHIEWPLYVRPIRAGDYFYPLGMSKKKKVSRFLIDNKIPVTEREDVWVVTTNKKILWLVGLRIDERFKIAPTTTKTLALQFKRND